MPRWGDVGLGGVDYLVGTEGYRHLGLARPAHPRHLRAQWLRDLHGKMAHPTGCPIHQNPLSRLNWPHVPQGLQRRQSRGRNGVGFPKGQGGWFSSGWRQVSPNTSSPG